jgi:hypothetical protein
MNSGSTKYKNININQRYFNHIIYYFNVSGTAKSLIETHFDGNKDRNL